MQGRAHGASLPLFSVLQKAEDIGVEKATDCLVTCLQVLMLYEHVDVVLLIQEGGMNIDLEPKTEFGKAVLGELQERMTIVSCPPGDCEYNSTGACSWCGDMRP